MSDVTFSLALRRPQLLTAYERLHWAERAAKVRALRQLAAYAWRQAGAVRLERAHCVVTVAWPDKRRRDAGNLHPTLKACVDGVVAAGLLPDDDDRHLTGPHLYAADEVSGDATTRIDFCFSPLD